MKFFLSCLTVIFISTSNCYSNKCYTVSANTDTTLHEKADSNYHYHGDWQSIKSSMVHVILRLTGIKKIIRLPINSHVVQMIDVPEPPDKIQHRLNVTKTMVGERDVFILSPKTNGSGKYVLYLHGGAFILNSLRLHWKYVAHLVEETNCTVIMPDYPLSPRYNYKDRFAMLDPLYKELVARVGGENVIVMGDSAGGNLALALAQKMRNELVEQPDQIILLSPWLDVSMTNPCIPKVDQRDPLLARGPAIRVGKLHAGNTNTKQYLVSPLYGPLHGLGKISIFTGTDDILNPDAKVLRALAAAEGVSINYYEYNRMIHAWVLLKMPEARKARQQIIALIKKNG